MENREYKHGNVTCCYFAYTPDEVRSWWTRSDCWYHEEAKARGQDCVVTPPLNEQDAVILSALFVRCIYAEPSRCHYDGETLSLYCGSSDVEFHAEKLVEGFLRAPLNHQEGPLFASSPLEVTNPEPTADNKIPQSNQGEELSKEDDPLYAYPS